ncbi:hypothetical protein QL285_029661 [Trifolium repens]|nr:hypothetical protein QL285_029661 [Trifolium repens]
MRYCGFVVSSKVFSSYQGYVESICKNISFPFATRLLNFWVKFWSSLERYLSSPNAFPGCSSKYMVLISPF